MAGKNSEIQFENSVSSGTICVNFPTQL